MKYLATLARFLTDSRGSSSTEHAVVLGLIVMGVLATAVFVGPSISDAMNSIRIPFSSPPASANASTVYGLELIASR